MRKNLPLFGSCLLALTLVFGMTTPISAQTQSKTLVQVETLKAQRQVVNLSSEKIINQPSNRSMEFSVANAETSESLIAAGCDQGDDSNGFENGFNITADSGYRSADDFFVSSNETLNVRSIVFNVFANYPVSFVDINFLNDDGGMPGSTTVESVTGLTPYAQVPIGAAFGYTVYAIHVEVDINFMGGASGTSYWMQPEVVSPMAFWEGSSAGTLGEVIHMSENMGDWLPDDDGGIHHGVFKLHCEVVTPPDPMCFNISDTIEPITRVIVADIDNTSGAGIDASPALEDFTHIEGVMAQGIAYDVALEGNTNGYVSFFTVWIDWDQNNIWDAVEMYEMGSISNSTGTDGQQATGTIPVPANATLGSTTMRVIKNWDTSPTDPCGVYLYGQAEDYTINIEAAMSVGNQSTTVFTYFPNPTSGVVNIAANKEISAVSVTNILGQKVLIEKDVENGRIDLTDLVSGAYIVRVALENGSIENFKILKK